MKNKFFPEINGNFGFGCMRLPVLDDNTINIPELKEMVDTFLDAGFNYFDTACQYHGGHSEQALKEALTSRYPREAYILADKLSPGTFQSEEEVRPQFEKQLKNCGVEYFDFLLMHAQTAPTFERYKKCRAFETAFALKKEGKVRHVGFSFHDKPEVLDQILNEYPEIEFVQIQFNYLDLNDPSIQSQACYDVCKKHGKPVFVMEPIRGGNLINLPKEATPILNEMNLSASELALRFAGTPDNIAVVLSGMSALRHIQDNTAIMKDFKPLPEEILKRTPEIASIIRKQYLIPCTACRYCVAGCPAGIAIPDIFACMNNKKLYNDFNANYYYKVVYTSPGHMASDCIGCGQCESVCTQYVPIRECLKQVALEFE